MVKARAKGVQERASGMLTSQYKQAVDGDATKKSSANPTWRELCRERYGG